MTLLSLKEGTKSWKGKGRAVAKSETNNPHLRDTFKTNHYIYLNVDKKKCILESHMFLYGTIKGRTVVGGNKQRKFIYKGDSSSPTVSNKAVLFSFIIYAEEKRDVDVIDTPNELVQTKTPPSLSFSGM